MRKQLEKDLQIRAIKKLRGAGFYVYRAMGNAMAATGTPDVLCCINGKFVAIEFKREHNGQYGVTEAQNLRMQQIENAGGLAYVVANLHEVHAIIEWAETSEHMAPSCVKCRRPVRRKTELTMHGYCRDCQTTNGDLLGVDDCTMIETMLSVNMPIPDIVAALNNNKPLNSWVSVRDVEDAIRFYDMEEAKCSAVVNGVGLRVNIKDNDEQTN